MPKKKLMLDTNVVESYPGQLWGAIATDFPHLAVSWTRSGVELEVDRHVGQSTLLGETLSAAYEYQRNTFSTAAMSPKYNVTRHDGDWIDNQHLAILIFCADGGVR